MFEEITQKTPFSALRCEHFFFFSPMMKRLYSLFGKNSLSIFESTSL
jgi:hypothetical protein